MPGYRNLNSILSRSGGLLERAETALRRTVAANPNDSAALLHLGNVQRGKGRLGEALECYWRVASLRPGDPKACWLVAILSGEALPNAPSSAQPVPFVREEDFLPPQRCSELLALALASRGRFKPALHHELRQDADGNPMIGKGRVDPSNRKAFIADPQITEREVRHWFEPRLRRAFAEALPRLEMVEPRKYAVSMGMSTRLDGGFYVKHEDNGPYGIRTKLVSSPTTSTASRDPFRRGTSALRRGRRHHHPNRTATQQHRLLPRRLRP